MTITELQQQYAAHPNMAVMERILKDPSIRTVFCGGLCASAASLSSSVWVRRGICPFVFILGDLEEAGYFYHDLTQILGTEQVLFFPSSFRRSVKYGQKDAANEILRTEVLSRLEKGEKGLCIVTYPDALAEKVVSRKELNDKTLKLNVGERVDTVFVTDVLHSYGFEYVDYVYEPGQYAVRGSIIDVFSFASEYPYRIDFFGDEVESIRTFEVESQLSREKKNGIMIVPDLAVTGEVTTSFLDFIPGETVLAMRDFLWLRERIQAVHDEALTPQAIAVQEAEENGGITLEGKLIDGSEFVSRALDFRRMEFGNKPTGVPDASVSFETSAQPIFHKNFDLVSDAFRDYIGKGYSLFVCSDSTKQTDRIKAIFEDRKEHISFTPVQRTLHEGFADDTLRMCVFTDHQLFDRFHKYNLKSDKARSGKVTLSLKELNQFTPGDYVVHTDHGIGRFAGLIRVPNGDTTQEVIKLIYQNEDVVFVSIHSLHKVSKYKGKEGEPPRLNKLGTGAWEKLKERTKTKIKDIARDLIKLYSQRRQEKGFSYSPDSFLQRELEASFIYEDTPDQSKATADVKTDMESERPMDRLVCGDVGFGKTEVAIRAAFKAVADNKQVAVLVPTTVLAYQHFRTFRERLKGLPCRVEYLSRARTAAQAKTVLKGLKEGEVNILIGTHRILGKDVRFKDLGLLIIDEEQKFGVSVKEKLRQMKVNVDTLTMTATPIPRTLQFSLMGARDLSVISTPPPNRYPIQTEVHTFNEEVIADAIGFEMSRNGQVFFVNNRIANLPELKAMILRHIPDCRVAIGHGQMEPAELEKVIFDFVNYDYDVLLATTIIESGIDIPNANTIIINQAQNFGLSDLHQMRGRVGRSNKKAFCYLLAPPLSSLTTEGRRRLQAIENFSDLGSGIHIAMQDLDIRGAGNLLGAEQSGFIADLGYETYQKILAEAVHELKNDEFAELYADEIKESKEISGELFVDECQIESDLEILLPADYVTGSSERMLLYRELDGLTLDKEVDAFRTRLEDRFGTVPPETEELLRVVPLRRLGARLGAEKIFLKGERMTLFFVSNPDSPFYQSRAFGQAIEYMMKYTRRCDLREQNGRRSMVVKDVGNVETAVSVLQEMVAMPVGD
ncbi:transcription-repair coupling factor [Bacteroides pyogenes]|uniref:transcription-repair coupling factor n=1 Tax=Bacteroides pyogenes TaxID=310300 RepID=UPI0011E4680C|nr:transcription-repair coupling factor [Bacteroides pyogenes]MBR8708372.1 Transcription-repair-coupling factor [Bacteroides pyogenes]MBR8716837.1 Transcription-repair-coupling factor [Bacteroides pyogenes]MBR8746696.1 Transcription-repair-coupling factor [Bacteroides pyogenes]MBR8756968.1 Transcription-repair-coupling factor [Bacteroides pyogenes]MBR8780241.1 Transcription-repair-coupling factor [Bacteroides pyogenes]